MSNKRKLVVELLGLVSAISGDYTGVALDLYDSDLELEFDEATQACKSKMYMYMLGGRDEDEKDFWTLYNALDERKKAYINKEYENIMNARANQGFDEQNTKEEKGTQKTIGRKEDRYE